ncbi:MAG: threonylcarbamoyl-AMP synthase [Candidatus Aminicenantes bacterium]|nr:threonylcarbamoyl-AMP synthase [Candidatus Aminicenantes bacterium]
MEIIDFKKILDRENKIRIKHILEGDGIIIYPTDTLYGIGGNFFSPKVLEKIDCLKQRDDMPYSAAVAGLEMIKKLTAGLPPYFEKLAEKIFPGKFTVLLKAAKSINKILLKNRDKIGIRIPGIPPLIELLQYLNMPLISTSVNRSGSPPLRHPEAIKSEFPEIDLFIDAGVLPESQGSTVLDLTESPVRVVRKGDDYDQISVTILRLFF